MTLKFSFSNCVDLHNQAYQCLIQGDYYQGARLYEQAIAIEPDVKSHYWHLGLVLLLQGHEAEAQTTWLMALVEQEPAEIEQWTVELMSVLETEAQRRLTLRDYSTAWLLRQHIREIQPTNINNLLHLAQLAIKLDTLTNDELNALELIPLLKADILIELDIDLLLQVLQEILNSVPLFPASLEFAQACLPYIEPLPLLRILLQVSVTVAYSMQQPAQGARIAKLCLDIAPDNPEVLRHLAAFYQNSGEHSKGIEIAKQYYSLMENLLDKVLANHMVLRGLMHAGGYWEEASLMFQRHESLLLSLIAEQPSLVDKPHMVRLLTSTFFFPYWRDEAQSNRLIQNEVAKLFQSSLQNSNRELRKQYNSQLILRKTHSKSKKKLKIGYLSAFLKRHSVGWLARWLFEHHNRDLFEIYGYFVCYKDTYHPLQEWYINQVDKAHKLGTHSGEIAKKIYEDEIDILIDLDSITLDISCEVMALKPAPIQVTWLGWDASGIPAIDYYIADPYVLPDSAQNYYTEKIWRLPETYIAVDGFEVGIPSLRREHLDIPNDAVVYLSAQGNYKRHPKTVRLQMQILKEVPNSYFLIKGFADEEAVKDFFIQIAQEEGVNAERLRFLPDVALEAVHRANLYIADVVLDTYPYNGATTTLETLWMCVPLVTKVGQQFAARNSYTMMMNAGVAEGIAWTNEEYVEWGVRLGKDSALRQKIAWQLRQSRLTAPLWNGKRFTCHMEKAYEEMWQRYLEAE
ncbi:MULTISPECIES: O-linked N-acetylglucosamine transferase, SPINDLY family protein [Nostocales]|uniref:O-linked N-acetylglucosamine transferase, SPINDLY family protein n=3 Tax=Nostocales TaxID=1161 RepID=A0A0C1RDN2_9CYAN|nr:O-linked N-acetylglucosamine transferase, SPINDLY family protein [Tolypothrix bouteillei]KAF3886316.1 O-linked N-acetylglucosamine transferase, SPINDLY family protein [Tolypothrix bouteillei VB521301]